MKTCTCNEPINRIVIVESPGRTVAMNKQNATSNNLFRTPGSAGVYRVMAYSAANGTRYVTRVVVFQK